MSKTQGGQLKALRQALGLTQKQLSRKMGFTTAQFVSNWERDVSAPSAAPSEIRQLAKALRVHPDVIATIIYEREQRLRDEKWKLIWASLRRKA